MKIKHLFIIATLLFIVFTKCAKVSSPTGGPRDSIPPLLISSTPENYSVNIKETDIEITFDEYIQLKDVNSTLIISPPLEEKPEIKLKGKTVSIDLNNELKDSTTYTLNFGNSIVDNNESNPIENFEFVFGTGSSLDSFSVTGTLLNSLTLKPSENPIFIGLYKNIADTAPLTQIPYYIGRTNKEGKYSINNIASGTYRLFALEDANNNLFYDLPNENIAFFDSLITIDPSIFEEIEITEDSLINVDSLAAENDTISANDSVLYKKRYAFHAPLFLFQESVPSQYITDNNREDSHRMQIVLNEPYRDSIQFSILDSQERIELINSFSKNFDTLTFWLPDTISSKKDSIKTIFSFYATDSVFNYYWKTDTLDFNYRKPKTTPAKRGKKEEDKEQNKSIKLKATVRSGKTLDLNKKITIDATYPIDTINVDSIKLFSVKDSIKTIEKFEIAPHPYDITKFSIQKKWNPLANYELYVIPGAVNNIYGYPCDSLDLSFTAQEKEYYGALKLNVTGFENPVIIQLMDKNREKILDERFCNGDTSLLFDYMHPETYQLKMIHDLDSNKKWTTGNYNENKQPEKVEFYSKTLNIRSNWEIEEIWEHHHHNEKAESEIIDDSEKEQVKIE